VLVDRDVTRIAWTLIDKHGLAKAETLVNRRVETLAFEGETSVAAIWRQVLDAIERVRDSYQV
jgi:hypothetical protein